MSYKMLPEFFKKIVRPAYYYLQRKKLARYNVKYKVETDNYHSIPIIINNFNRLAYMLQLIEGLEKRGYYNIHIIDNSSTLPALLNYYEKCPYKVYRLSKNLGYLALWKSELYKYFINGYYVYTDSDIVLTNECPQDFMKIFLQKLTSDSSILKVGFSLKIDDLPEHFKFKRAVIENELQYFVNKDSDLFYRANIDTTFALYRPGARGGANLYQKMYRSAFPYEARHMPWYSNSDHPTEEDLYYIKSVQQSTHWSALSKKANL